MAPDPSLEALTANYKLDEWSTKDFIAEVGNQSLHKNGLHKRAALEVTTMAFRRTKASLNGTPYHETDNERSQRQPKQVPTWVMIRDALKRNGVKDAGQVKLLRQAATKNGWLGEELDSAAAFVAQWCVSFQSLDAAIAEDARKGYPDGIDYNKNGVIYDNIEVKARRAASEGQVKTGEETGAVSAINEGAIKDDGTKTPPQENRRISPRNHRTAFLSPPSTPPSKPVSQPASKPTLPTTKFVDEEPNEKLQNYLERMDTSLAAVTEKRNFKVAKATQNKSRAKELSKAIAKANSSIVKGNKLMQRGLNIMAEAQKLINEGSKIISKGKVD